MKIPNRCSTPLAALMMAALLMGCSADGGSSSTPATTTTGGTLPQEPGAPAFLGNIAVDGFNWINYRRSQANIPQLARNPLIDTAAQGHSDYLKTNNIVSHDQIAGNPGFTGVDEAARLTAAHYTFANASRAYGEVISGTSSDSGFFMAEELITAIYHRFVIFEPQFKEIGTGAARTSAGYTYFTADFAANNGYGPGLGGGNVSVWPFNGQLNVAPNFFSDNESPDPVANANEVGYPISVHADLDSVLTVQSFTVHARGGADLSSKLLRPGDPDTPASATALIPLTPLLGNTTYDVSFVGTVKVTGTLNEIPVTRLWFFTTK